jgi:hypothetical protein
MAKQKNIEQTLKFQINNEKFNKISQWKFHIIHNSVQNLSINRRIEYFTCLFVLL